MPFSWIETTASFFSFLISECHLNSAGVTCQLTGTQAYIKQLWNTQKWADTGITCQRVEHRLTCQTYRQTGEETKPKHSALSLVWMCPLTPGCRRQLLTNHIHIPELDETRNGEKWATFTVCFGESFPALVISWLLTSTIKDAGAEWLP